MLSLFRIAFVLALLPSCRQVLLGPLAGSSQSKPAAATAAPAPAEDPTWGSFARLVGGRWATPDGTSTIEVQWIVPGKTLRIRYSTPHGTAEQRYTLDAAGRFTLVSVTPEGTSRFDRLLEDGWMLDRERTQRMRYAFLSEGDVILVRQRLQDGTWVPETPISMRRVADVKPIVADATPPAPQPPRVAKSEPQAPPPKPPQREPRPEPRREPPAQAKKPVPSSSSSPIAQAKGCAKNVEHRSWIDPDGKRREIWGIPGELAPIALDRVLGTYLYEGGSPRVVLRRSGGTYEVHGAPKDEYVYEIKRWWVETTCDGKLKMIEGQRGVQYTLAFELDRDYQGQRYDRVPLALPTNGPSTILGERVRR